MAAKKPPAATSTAPDTANESSGDGAATAVLDPPAAETGEAKEVWAKEHVDYLFEPETRELIGAHIFIEWDDGQTGQRYEADIKRDGGDNWAWWEGDDYRGNHSPGIHQLIGRALARGRGLVLQGMT